MAVTMARKAYCRTLLVLYSLNALICPFLSFESSRSSLPSLPPPSAFTFSVPPPPIHENFLGSVENSLAKEEEEISRYLTLSHIRSRCDRARCWDIGDTAVKLHYIVSDTHSKKASNYTVGILRFVRGNLIPSQVLIPESDS